MASSLEDISYLNLMVRYTMITHVCNNANTVPHGF